MTDPPVLVPARIRWDGDTPVNDDFGDTYFSTGQGPAESRHVFIDGNRLEERFGAGARPRFKVLETGFGTGLNFLLTTELWRHSAAGRSSWLEFWSVEGHPLGMDDLRRAVRKLCPESVNAVRLLENYPPAVAGIYTIDFPATRSTLVLCQFDIDCALGELVNADNAFDALFLDGFAPSGNPAMWSGKVAAALYRLTRPGGTFATFTAAGRVRRTLEAAGFEVERRPGFGAKREHLAGAKAGDPGRRPAGARRVAVVGGGLAGSATARALLRRGIDTTLFDAGAGSGRAGNALPVAVYGPQLSADFSLTSRFYWHGLWRLKSWLSLTDGGWFSAAGIAFFAWHDEDRRRYEKLIDLLDGTGAGARWLDEGEAAALLCIRSRAGALFIPHGGALDTSRLRETWLNETGGRLQTLTGPVTAIEHGDDAVRLNGAHEFDAVVLATGANLELPEHLGVAAVRRNFGRAWSLERTDLPATDTVLSFRGYLTPPLVSTDVRLFGATYERREPRDDVATRMRGEKIERFEKISGLALEAEELRAGNEHTGWRAESADRLPLVGALGSKRGIYLNIAHASRGATSSFICGETVAASITGDIPPLPRRLVEIINPGRFD